jgi:hypothetical protein
VPRWVPQKRAYSEADALNKCAVDDTLTDGMDDHAHTKWGMPRISSPQPVYVYYSTQPQAELESRDTGRTINRSI